MFTLEYKKKARKEFGDFVQTEAHKRKKRKGGGGKVRDQKTLENVYSGARLEAAGVAGKERTGGGGRGTEDHAGVTVPGFLSGCGY